MKKLIALAVIMLLPLGAIAQEVKIAYVNTQEIMMAMPELSDMEKKLADLNESYTSELKRMEEDYNRKTQEYIAAQDSLTENIKLRRMQEIEGMRERMEQVYQMGQQEMSKKQEELFAPIQQKMMDAIKSVGNEKGYTYILNPASILYTGDAAIDATPFVKTKLGI
ncbi:outer membrane protein [Parabacteroides sp. PM5-20]|uniref:OmpH family outer membrane protein n=1 Tax=Parabacteroides sp. PM5-20 TaxID=2940527 RepID=UPI002474698B|nr:OmpH family outer membrane protein [Parabacteroides sp. PM5-20]MDH6534122.1 outer membrane protein [Parabacteroides sp. PM5-20]